MQWLKRRRGFPGGGNYVQNSANSEPKEAQSREEIVDRGSDRHQADVQLNEVFMKVRLFVFALVAMTFQTSWASPKCSLPFFSPTLEYGQLGPRELLEFNFADKDENVAFEYIESGMSSSNSKYGMTYRVQIFTSDGDSTKHRVVLEWVSKLASDGKSGNLANIQRTLSDVLNRRINKAVAPIILRTHYSTESMEVGCLDGFVAQVSLPVENSSYWSSLGGETYTPPRKSEAGAVVELGRSLRKFADGSITEDSLKIALDEVEQFSNPAH